jgi:CheY-like chemotaxis protein
MNAVEMIEDAGFETFEAADGDEAIEILEGRPDIKVIFTDIQIPGSMDGLKLAHAVRGAMAADKNHCDFRARKYPDRRFARRWALFTKAVLA